MASAKNGVAAVPLKAMAIPVRSVYRYGIDVNSHDLVKVMAILAMVVDHTGKFFVDDNVWFRLVGRMAAGLFFFLVGYSGSYRFKLQILVLGIALWTIDILTSTQPTLWGRITPVNILISFVLIKAILDSFDPAEMRTESLLILLAILMVLSIPSYLVLEYGSLGLCYAIGARLLRQRHPLGRSWICATVGIHFLFEAVVLLVWNDNVSVHVLLFAIPLLAILFAVNLAIFLNYKFRTFRVEPRWMRMLLVYVSRYSLQIYFFHLAAFMIVYRIILR